MSTLTADEVVSYVDKLQQEFLAPNVSKVSGKPFYHSLLYSLLHSPTPSLTASLTASLAHASLDTAAIADDAVAEAAATTHREVVLDQVLQTANSSQPHCFFTQ